MYCEYYRFSEKPFEVTPDPKFLYLSPSHREMLASVVYGIRERRGFIALVGEVGTGKTTIINAALDRLNGNTKVAYLSNTALNFDQMLLMTLQELKLVDPGQHVTKVEAIRLLNDFTIRYLSKGGNVVLIIDEAQNLDAQLMENLRLLSNLETRKHKLIQIVLAGQPELDAKLGRPDLRQLAQRVSMRRTISPLKEEETYEYLQHRLTVADYRGSALFTKKAKELIYECSGGIPRKINILCDNALLIGFALKKRTIDVDCVTEAAEDLKWAPIDKANGCPSSTPESRRPQLAHRSLISRVALAGCIALAAGLALAAGFNFGRSGFTLPVSIPFFNESNRETGINPVHDKEDEPVPRAYSILPAEPDSPQQVSMDDGINPDGVTASSLGKVQSPGQAEHIPSPSKSEERKIPSHAGTPTEMEVAPPVKTAVTEKAEDASSRVVVVERADTLSGIIRRAYGRYEDRLLTKVLKENPEIRTPNYISVGQVIRLPEVK